MQRKLLRLLFRTRKLLSFRLSRKTLFPKLLSSAIRYHGPQPTAFGYYLKTFWTSQSHIYPLICRLRHVGKLRIYLSGLIERKDSCTSYLFMLHSHKNQGLQTCKNSHHRNPKKIHCFWFARIGTSFWVTSIVFYDAILPEH